MVCGPRSAVCRTFRAGFTLFVLAMVLTISATILGIIAPKWLTALDRISVRAASADLSATLHSARALAISQRLPVAVFIQGPSGTVRVSQNGATAFSRNIGFAHGVQLFPTRDSTSFGPLGLGRGAANLSVVVRRRAAVETVFVSRLGRIR